jgi:hypothetical protein
MPGILHLSASGISKGVYQPKILRIYRSIL